MSEVPDPATSHDTTFFYGTPAQVSVWIARFEAAGFVLVHRSTDEDGFDTAKMERKP